MSFHHQGGRGRGGGYYYHKSWNLKNDHPPPTWNHKPQHDYKSSPPTWNPSPWKKNGIQSSDLSLTANGNQASSVTLQAPPPHFKNDHKSQNDNESPPSQTFTTQQTFNSFTDSHRQSTQYTFSAQQTHRHHHYPPHRNRKWNSQSTHQTTTNDNNPVEIKSQSNNTIPTQSFNIFTQPKKQEQQHNIEIMEEEEEGQITDAVQLMKKMPNYLTVGIFDISQKQIGKSFYVEPDFFDQFDLENNNSYCFGDSSKKSNAQKVVLSSKSCSMFVDITDGFPLNFNQMTDILMDDEEQDQDQRIIDDSLYKIFTRNISKLSNILFVSDICMNAIYTLYLCVETQRLLFLTVEEQ